jgi:DNA-binding transcriptional regulator LsrR (DeoR family)
MTRRKSKYRTSMHEIFVIAVAWLTSIGFKQKRIAKQLGVGQGLVSRLFRDAQTMKYLGENLPFHAHAEGLTPEKLAQAKNLCVSDDDLEAQLKTLQSRKVAFKLAVAPSDEAEFGRVAAYYVLELLAQSAGVIGVGYGRMLGRLATEIGLVTHGDQPRFAGHTCVSLNGSPTHLLNQHEEIYTSGSIAGQLQQALTGKSLSNLPSLTGVQAYVPRMHWIPQSNQADVMKFVCSAPGYRKIFGGPGSGVDQPYVERMDAFLTGLGVVAPADSQCGPYDTGAFIRERIAAEHADDVTVETLRPLIYGDHGGILLPRDHVRDGSTERRLVDDLNRGWVGLRLEHLVRIADKAQVGGPPGIVVATAGHSKSKALLAARATMVQEIIKHGLVNHLIISADLADVLRDVVTQRATRTRNPDVLVVSCVNADATLACDAPAR